LRVLKKREGCLICRTFIGENAGGQVAGMMFLIISDGGDADNRAFNQRKDGASLIAACPRTARRGFGGLPFFGPFAGKGQ